MAIFRGTGGAGEANDDATLNAVTEQALDAATSASQAALSATAAASSATAAASSESSVATDAATASTAASNASTSATNAAASATAAASSASSASTSESNASTSETNAAASETAAAASETSAATSATNAASSATSASSSATAAQSAQAATENIFDQFGDQYLGSKTSDPTTDNDGDALNSGDIYWNSTNNTLRFYTGSAWVAPETVATTAATDASSSATAAASSATSASTSATNAATSETNAATSETNAATSATNAASSATAAASSETAAATSETNAATSASNASTSETNAATSASNAATSATSASNAQTAAETAQAAAEAAQEAIDGLYLGAQTSDPTLDNNGDPVTAGDWYYNTSTSVTRIYDGSAWQNGAVTTSGFLQTTNNLSDLGNAATARTNLGLGTAATTASTDYATAAQGALADSALQSYTETDPIVGAVSGIVKANGAGTISAAVADTDYLTPTGDGSGLTGIAAGAQEGLFWENNQTVTANYTVTTNKNAGTFGPVTINTGVTVTVPTGSTWTIV